MKQEPQLDTRIRESYADAVICGRSEGLVKVRVLIMIEDAPILITGATPATTLIALVLLPPLDGFFDKS